MTLVDEEFLSVTKAFKIKKDVENYFAEALLPLSDNPEETYELQYRFLILSIWMRCDYLNAEVDWEIMAKAEHYTDTILNILSNRLNKTQYTFLKLSIYLALSRRINNPIVIPPETMKMIETGLIFNMFQDIFNEHEDKETLKKKKLLICPLFIVHYLIIHRIIL